MSVDSGSRRRRSSAANLIDALMGVGKSLVNKVAPTAPNRYTYSQCFWHRFSFIRSNASFPHLHSTLSQMHEYDRVEQQKYSIATKVLTPRRPSSARMDEWNTMWDSETRTFYYKNPVTGAVGGRDLTHSGCAHP